MIQRTHSAKLIIIGVFLFLFGGLLLLWTTGYLSSMVALWPTLIILSGMVFLYRSFFGRVAERNLFIGMLSVLAGIFLLLLNTVIPPGSLSRIWPVFMTIIGIALLPYGFTKRGSARTALIIPGLALVFLSLVFLAFSLGLVSLDFRKAAAVWWPVLFMLAGIAIAVADFVRKRDPSDQEVIPEDLDPSRSLNDDGKTPHP